MYKGKRILAIIPARGGSKGLARKNIRELYGHPLIYWTIERAKQSKYIDYIFVSTDSQEIADVCQIECAITVDELRPENLAQDDTSSTDVIKYTIEKMESVGERFNYMILLEPTSPLRKESDIDSIIKLACDNPIEDGVISCGEIHMEHPIAAKMIDDNGHLTPYIEKRLKVYQRQQMDKVYFPYGVAYLIKIDVFMKGLQLYTNKILPYVIERWQGYEVDDIYDMLCIEAVMKHERFRI